MTSGSRIGAQISGARILAVIGGVVAAVYLANPFLKWFPWTPQPIWAGITAVGLVYAVYVGATRDFKIWNAVRGADGRASTSKFQVFLWTVVVLFAYVAILATRWKAGHTETLPDLPSSILTALGISSGTAVAAQAIVSNAIGSGSVAKPPTTNHAGLAPIFQDDAGQPDLSKIQLIAWTLIAIGVFLAGVLRVLGDGATDATLPDIDPTLLVLTGLGSATYLGRKLVPTSTPMIASLAVSPTDPRSITIRGANFGDSQGGSQVSIDGIALQTRPTAWADTEITFVVPPKKPDGTPWKSGVPLAVKVTVSGTQSPGPTVLTLEAP